MTDHDAAGRFRRERADRLLFSLPEELLVTEKARLRVSKLKAADPDTENEASTGPTQESSPETGEQANEAPTATERMQRLRGPVESFVQQYRNASPAELTSDIEQQLRELWTALQTAEEDGVTLEVADAGWHEAVQAADAIL